MSTKRVQQNAAISEGSLSERRDRVQIAAYLRSEERGFAPGLELEDWSLAEEGLEPKA